MDHQEDLWRKDGIPLNLHCCWMGSEPSKIRIASVQKIRNIAVSRVQVGQNFISCHHLHILRTWFQSRNDWIIIHKVAADSCNPGIRWIPRFFWFFQKDLPRSTWKAYPFFAQQRDATSTNSFWINESTTGGSSFGSTFRTEFPPDQSKTPVFWPCFPAAYYFLPEVVLQNC